MVDETAHQVICYGEQLWCRCATKQSFSAVQHVVSVTLCLLPLRIALAWSVLY